MAIQTGEPRFGTIGPYIFYKWKEIPCVRAKGYTGRQAKVAKEQAAILGKASAIGARIRAGLKPVLPSKTDRQIMYRLNKGIQQFLRSSQQIGNGPINDILLFKEFSFRQSTGNTDMRVSVTIRRTNDNKLILDIPAFNSPNPIAPLAFHGKIILQVITVSCRVSEPADTISNEMLLEIDYDGTSLPAQELLLPQEPREGCLNLVVLSVNKVTAEIIGAFYN